VNQETWKKSPSPEDVADLTSFCQDVFSSFRRSDQRRWGAVYVRGLLNVEGRKTIKKISEHIVGGQADQSLQQFVNQSSWRWEPVRHALLRRVMPALRPRAWVVRDAVFPKEGTKSVGVAKQYAGPSANTINCQLGLAIFAVGEAAGCALNWRLPLPRSWDRDDVRRKQADVPVSERHAPRSHHVLDMVDEMTVEWCTPPSPLVVDARGEQDLDVLLRGLEEREVDYAVQVDEGAVGRARYARDSDRSVSSSDQPRAKLVGQPRISVSRPRVADGRKFEPQHLFSHVRCRTSQGRMARFGVLRQPDRNHVLVAEWSSRPRPVALWLTNMTAIPLGEFAHLTTSTSLAAWELDRMGDGFGLRHFEGRSFGGWHHHVTLVSTAHTYSTLKPLEAAPWKGELPIGAPLQRQFVQRDDVAGCAAAGMGSGMYIPAATAPTRAHHAVTRAGAADPAVRA
jgi:DDE superfamily endonuclease